MKPRAYPLLLSVLLAAGAAGAQGTSPPAQTRSATRVQPAKPATPSPRAAAAPMPTTPDQRPPAPVPVRGAARTQEAATPAAKKPAPTSSAQAKVYDRAGRLLPGMQAAGPNRVLDTRTGRYHDTVPMGDGQRIVR